MNREELAEVILNAAPNLSVGTRGNIESAVLQHLASQRQEQGKLVRLWEIVRGRYHLHDGVAHSFLEMPLASCSLCEILAEIAPTTPTP